MINVKMVLVPIVNLTSNLWEKLDSKIDVN
jgi:hypothetical protein